MWTSVVQAAVAISPAPQRHTSDPWPLAPGLRPTEIRTRLPAITPIPGPSIETGGLGQPGMSDGRCGMEEPYGTHTGERYELTQEPW